jgi:hypothetical protein
MSTTPTLPAEWRREWAPLGWAIFDSRVPIARGMREDLESFAHALADPAVVTQNPWS